MPAEDLEERNVYFGSVLFVCFLNTALVTGEWSKPGSNLNNCQGICPAAFSIWHKAVQI